MAFISPTKVDFSGNFQSLLDQYGAVAFDRQYDLLEYVQGESWGFDMDSGILSFGQKLKAPTQLIGSFSYTQDSWLWGWGNTASGFPESLTTQSLRMKELGEKNNIEQFVNRSFDTDESQGHIFAMIAAGLFGASAYYPADYGEGYLFMTLESPELDEFAAGQSPRILTVFPQFISSFEVNHRIALKYYLQAKGFSVKEEDATIHASSDGNEISAIFDAQDRLISLDGQVATGAFAN